MKTTLLLLLLPLTALCQAPPCLTGNFIWQGAYEFGIAFPDDGCQYIASWQDDYIECHGAMNRYMNFQRINIANDTTITVQAGAFPLTPTSPQPDPTNLVFTFWDACPFQGGNTVASIACGGWDCIEWGEVGFTATLTLEAGIYWFWAGLYSDGVTCNSGVVQGGISTGGTCETPPIPDYLPCPTVTVAASGQTFTYCEGGYSEPFDTGLPCSPQDDYMTVEFTTDGSPYPIHVWSNSNYVNFPNSPINYPDFAIYTGCGGDLVYTTFGGSCAYGSDIAPPAPSGIEYTVSLDLPAGTYVAVIGFWSAVGSPYESEGCIQYTFGGIQFLNLPPTDQVTDQVTDQETDQAAPLYPRYTKVVIEGRGVFIRDGYTGAIYDIVTRRVIQ